MRRCIGTPASRGILRPLRLVLASAESAAKRDHRSKGGEKQPTVVLFVSVVVFSSSSSASFSSFFFSARKIREGRRAVTSWSKGADGVRRDLGRAFVSVCSVFARARCACVCVWRGEETTEGPKGVGS